ncbi:MAG: GTPase Era [Chloroflexota bacterium]
MFAISFDPESRTLYWYFTEIIAGSTTAEDEGTATLYLDASQQLIGAQIALDYDTTEDNLTGALEHPAVSFHPENRILAINLFNETPAETIELAELAVMDFDEAEQLQGFELQLPPVEQLDVQLERITSFLITLDSPAEDLEDVERTPETQMFAPDTEENAFRSGFVALVGKPNVGKSTLLNALLGRKITIVSPKPHTTRIPVRGILTTPEAQLVFVDTPGIHDPRNKLGSFMVDQAQRAIPDADVVCFIVDISAPPSRLDKRIATITRRSRTPRILVLNKTDQPSRDGQPHLEAYRELGPWDMEIAISALKEEGLDTLVEEIVRHLPVGTSLYPGDQVTDQNTRTHAAELVREQVLHLTEQEIPHSVAVEVDEWEERERVLYVRMTINVERESQKAIVIGAKGAMLKRIGSAARKRIEEALGRSIYLDLWVKARTNWRDDPTSLHWLGYTKRKT